jgi:thioredoxin-related protein
MNKLVLLVLVLIPLMVSSQGYDRIQTRNAGVVEDMKYIGKGKNTYMFLVYTSNSRMYTISSNHIPYFDLKDSVVEYWIEYRLKGLGKKSRTFYYPVHN